MGVVYAAYDPELDRRVAIKVLRIGGEASGSAGRGRLLREAQAMAKLSHDNVLPVHDVGPFGDSVFVAMEIVEGETLFEWQRRPGRTVPEILGAYVAAGRGLAAAHAAGLVHRDFKPQNVLRGRDGRVRVTDFGLVRSSEEPAVRSAGSPDGQARTAALASDLTAAGQVLGTPHYMAPEQFKGGTADARSDQFAFAVALWEALFHQRPFGGETVGELIAALNEPHRTPPARPGVTSRIVKALDRGLARDPGARHPSMEVFLAELELGAKRRPLAPWIAAGVLGAIAAAAVTVSGADQRDVCQAAGGRAEALVSPAALGEIEAAFVRSGLPFAADAYQSTQRRLLDWSAAFGKMARESCVATRIERTQSEALGDLRAACLDRRLAQASALVEKLRHAERETVEGSTQAVMALTPLAGCADAVALTERAPLPDDPVKRARIDDLARRISRLSGDYTFRLRRDALEEANALVEAARAEGYPPVVAAALYARARIEILGDPKKARDTYLESAAAAMSGNDDETLVDAYTQLVWVATEELSDHAEAERWARLAEGALGRLSDPDRARASFLQARGSLHRNAGRLKEARRDFEEAFTIVERRFADDPLQVTESLRDLANVDNDEGKQEDAAARLARAEKLLGSLHGRHHPAIARLLHSQGVAELQRGDARKAAKLLSEAAQIELDAGRGGGVEHGLTLQALGAAENTMGRTAEAEEHLVTALQIIEKRLGPEHADTARVLNDLGGVYHKKRDYAAALAANQRAMAIKERVYGGDHPEVGYALVNMAIELKNLSRFDEVEKNYRRALGIFESKLGPDHFTVGVTWINLGEALRVWGRQEAALDAYGRARKILEAALGPEHIVLGHVWNGVGQSELARGRLREAQAALEHAVSLREKEPDDADPLAESRFALARALVAQGGDRARARKLAEEARAGYASLGDAYHDKVVDVERWLAR